MIVPIKTGSSIIPVYIPQPVSTNSGVLDQSNTNIQNNEPTLATWIVLGVVLIFLIASVACFIKLLKDFFGGKNDN